MKWCFILFVVVGLGGCATTSSVLTTEHTFADGTVQNDRLATRTISFAWAKIDGAGDGEYTGDGFSMKVGQAAKADTDVPLDEIVPLVVPLLSPAKVVGGPVSPLVEIMRRSISTQRR